MTNHGIIEKLARQQFIQILQYSSTILALYMITAHFIDYLTALYWFSGLGFILFLVYNFYYRLLFYPPGPMPLPMLGNVFDVDMKNPSKSFAEIGQKYGGIFTIWLPDPIIVITSREALKQALVTQGAEFAGRPTGAIWSAFTGNLESGNGIILCEGECYTLLRKLAIDILRSDFGMGNTRIEERILSNVLQLKAFVNLEMEGRGQCDIDMEAPISLCVANVIQAFVVGRTYEVNDPEFKTFKQLIDEVLEDVTSEAVQMLNSWPILSYFPNKRLKRYIINGFRLQQYFLDHINRIRDTMDRDGEPESFIEAFLRKGEQHPDNEHYNPLTLALASGDLWTGGMETTVTILRWLIIYLMRNQDVQEKCHKEIMEVFGTNEPSYAERERMPYMRATIAETLRVVNVLPWAIPHRTIEDTKLNGYFIKAKTTIMTQFGATHLDPELFPNPEEFLPERFIENPLLSKDVFPFGLGARSCIGMNLANYELFLISTVLIQNFKFETITGEKEPSLERTKGMTNKPTNYRCRVTQRQEI